MTTLRAGAATDVGRVRQINEDRYLCEEDLFAVADGVGGHQAGEVAAQTAVETLVKQFVDKTTDGLVNAVHEANEAVWRLAQTTSEKRGMGTTITALALVREDGEDLLALANVGDSRVYRIQDGELLQLTDDHSLVEEMVREGKLTREEAGVHPQRSIITRALGMEPDIEVDSWTLIPYRGDRLLLCSDGLTNELSDDRIAATLRQVADPQEAASDLVRQARAEGGGDNITVVIVDVVDDEGRAEQASAELARDEVLAAARAGAGGPPTTPVSRIAVAPTEEDVPRPRPAVAAPPADPPRRPASPAPAAAAPKPKRFTWRVAGFVFLLLAVVFGTLAAIGWYARGTYYVGFAGDQIAIYKGRPGGVLWFKPTIVDQKRIPRADVPAVFVPAVEKGKLFDSKVDADRYVTRLRDIHTEEVAAQASAPTTTAPPATAPPVTAAPEPPP
jgi:protein phosphatase